MKGSHNKIGNAHLKRPSSEAAVLFHRHSEPAKRLQQRLTSRYGNAKALSLIAQKLGRTVYCTLKRSEPSDVRRFFGDGGHERHAWASSTRSVRPAPRHNWTAMR